MAPVVAHGRTSAVVSRSAKSPRLPRFLRIRSPLYRHIVTNVLLPQRPIDYARPTSPENYRARHLLKQHAKSPAHASTMLLLCELSIHTLQLSTRQQSDAKMKEPDDNRSLRFIGLFSRRHFGLVDSFFSPTAETQITRDSFYIRYRCFE